VIGPDPSPVDAGARPATGKLEPLVAALADLVGAGLDPAAALGASARVLRAAVGADATTIYVVDPRRDVLLRAVTTDPDAAHLLAKLAGRPPSELPLLRALRETPEGVLLVPDTLTTDDLGQRASERFGARAVLALVIGGAGSPEHEPDVEALAICRWRLPNPAVELEAVEGARRLAALAAAAISNAHRHEEAERLARRLSELAGWAGRLATCDDPESVVALSAEAAAALLDAPVAVVWSPDATGVHPSPADGGPELERELAAVAAGGGRLAVIQAADLPPALGAMVEGAGLTRLLTSAAADGGAVLAAARRDPPSPVEEELAPLLADLAGAAVRSSAAVARLAEQALTDPLTEIGNRRAFEAAFDAALAQSARYRRPLALALLDIDDFHAINERGGHPHGDRILRTVARVLREELRRTDFAFRIGGDEFALIIPETRAASTGVMLERVLARVRGSSVGPVTLSAGVADAREGPDLDSDLLRRADEALYRAKRDGGDKIDTTPDGGG
jgi:diguanylate cyclase (GGDEF)-like protein